MVIKVGVKYCGGCNPNYDRVELGEGIRKKLDGKADFVVADSENVDVILAIEGCETACADLSVFKDKRIFIMTGEEETYRFIKLIEGLTCAQR
ncbi:MAG: hypothetical protein ACK2TV_07315 [Anaerolineales bacterium]